MFRVIVMGCWVMGFLPLSGCGNLATPLNIELVTTQSDDGDLDDEILLGIADPTASRFSNGMLLSTRWTISIQDVRTTELFVDMDLAGVPERIVAGSEPAILSLGGDELESWVDHRDILGKQLSQQLAVAAEIVIESRSTAGVRDLSSGSFVIELAVSGDRSIFRMIEGSWLSPPD